MMGKAWSGPQPGLWVPLRMGDNRLPCPVTPPAVGQVVHFPSTQKGLEAKPSANSLFAPNNYPLFAFPNQEKAVAQDLSPGLRGPRPEQAGPCVTAVPLPSGARCSLRLALTLPGLPGLLPMWPPCCDSSSGSPASQDTMHSCPSSEAPWLAPTALLAWPLHRLPPSSQRSHLCLQVHAVPTSGASSSSSSLGWRPYPAPAPGQATLAGLPELPFSFILFLSNRLFLLKHLKV